MARQIDLDALKAALRKRNGGKKKIQPKIPAGMRSEPRTNTTEETKKEPNVIAYVTVHKGDGHTVRYDFRTDKIITLGVSTSDAE